MCKKTKKEEQHWWLVLLPPATNSWARVKPRIRGVTRLIMRLVIGPQPDNVEGTILKITS